jgi:sarcosine oxidase subunit alpha
MRVDGTPNVRTCVTPAIDGMKVESQNAFPSARRDLLGIVDKVYPKTLDLHDRFTRPKLLASAFRAVARRMAGFGRIPDARLLKKPAIHHRDVDVLVVGAGPAGLHAAAAAAEGAATVLLVDEAERLGGTLLLHPEGTDASRDHLTRIHEAGGESMSRATAIGVYLTDGHGEALPPPGLVAILTPERVIEVRAKALVVATGYHEAPALLPNNDLPGVIGTRAALSLLHHHGVLVGKRLAFAGNGPLTPRARIDFQKAGCTFVDGPITEILGGHMVEGAIIHGQKVKVDGVLCAGDETPRVELLQQAGARLGLAGYALTPLLDGVATNVPGVFAAGTVADPRMSLDSRMSMGARTGEAAAKHARGAR